MSPYTLADLMRDHGDEWWITVHDGAIRAVHKQARPEVSFEEADPEPLHEKLRAWEDQRRRQRSGGRGR